MSLTGILTTNEIRQALGYDPIEEEVVEAPVEPSEPEVEATVEPDAEFVAEDEPDEEKAVVTVPDINEVVEIDDE